MKFLLVICLIIQLSSVNLTFAGRCKRATKVCRTGGFGILYNDCTQICCGGVVYERDVHVACCGNVLYNKTTEICCTWKDEGKVHARSNSTSGNICCGLDLYNPEINPNLTCCNGYTVMPQPFNILTEMCCDGVVNFAGDTAYTQCCGQTAFDRRVASCPCEDDTVYLIPFLNAMCCPGNGGSNAAYDSSTQGCCNGVVYDLSSQSCCNGNVYNLSTQFCCGGRAIGITATEFCCSSTVVPLPATNGSLGNLACCPLGSGAFSVYDPRSSLCCGNRVVPKDSSICCSSTVVPIPPTTQSPENLVCCPGAAPGVFSAYDPRLSLCCGNQVVPKNSSTTQICCGNTVYDSAQFGTQCCGNVPFFPTTSVCCNGVVSLGNGCCNNVPYSTNANQFCCDGVIYNNFTAVVPACCFLVPFDSYFETCCGPTIFDNPRFVENGSITISHTTRCCGLFSEPTSLRPYDYFTQTCCDGVIVNLTANISPSAAVCCGQSVIDSSSQLCCGNQTINNPFGSDGVCCGNQLINLQQEFCCGGLPRNRTTGVCCGNTFATVATQLCCNGVPTPLNGVSPQVAACCAGAVFDSSNALCCAGIVINIGTIPPANAFCCAGAVFDSSNALCCAGNVVDIGTIPSANAFCCGTSVIDNTLNGCCAGVVQNRPATLSDVCCGTSLMDPTVEICCENVPRSLNGIDPDKAICCGDGCIDGDLFWCCDGKQYSKGAVAGVELSSLTCSSVLPING